MSYTGLEIIFFELEMIFVQVELIHMESTAVFFQHSRSSFEIELRHSLSHFSHLFYEFYIRQFRNQNVDMKNAPEDANRRLHARSMPTRYSQE